ncbi:DNA MISMATCH REPAIR PROTEIN MSH1, MITOCHONDRIAL [Ceraceosorus bombacis]|uniref:DNA MISMATCH REPAIR PROTEIN MSH1, MITOCHONDRIAL n=1 Tax=Ceraceosorus bombacis TaxID=401625 RepID=A0A0N7L9C5_9BASI|nr:DNA MISMATCH REPAIR PROTEIN MSH1, MITOCHONDRIAL [Ceraceosorus bombacis]
MHLLESPYTRTALAQARIAFICDAPPPSWVYTTRPRRTYREAGALICSGANASSRAPSTSLPTFPTLRSSTAPRQLFFVTPRQSARTRSFSALSIALDSSKREQKAYADLPISSEAALPPWQPVGEKRRPGRKKGKGMGGGVASEEFSASAADGSEPGASKGNRGAKKKKQTCSGDTRSSSEGAGLQQDQSSQTSSEATFDRYDPRDTTLPNLARSVLADMQRFPGCMLLTRVGGFYESYFDQAPQLSNMLGIKLAQRLWGGRTIAMAGFPIHQLEKHLKILVQDHHKLVAICDEFKSITNQGGAEKAATLTMDIQRRVTRVISPGTLIDERFLDPFKSNWVVAVSSQSGESHLSSQEHQLAPNGIVQDAYGLAWVDVSTADFFTTTCADGESLRDELARIGPSEVVLESGAFDKGLLDATRASGRDATLNQLGDPIDPLPHPIWEALNPHTVHISLCGAPHRSHDGDVEARAVLQLTDHLRGRLISHGDGVEALAKEGPTHRAREETMLIDANTLAALEIKQSMRENGSVRGSLLSTVRRTVTKGGTRLLGQWLTSPSTSLELIKRRQSIVAFFVNRTFLREDLRALLRRGAGDVSRGLQRITTGRNDEQDLLEIRDFIVMTQDLLSLLDKEMAQLRQAQQVTQDDVLIAGLENLDLMKERFKNLEGLGARLVEAMDEAVLEQRLRRQEALAREVEESLLDDEARGEISNGAVTVRKKKGKQPGEQDDGESSDGWGDPFEHLIRPSSSHQLRVTTEKYEATRQAASRLQRHLQERYHDRVTLRNVLAQGYVVHFAGADRKGNLKMRNNPEDEMTAGQKLKTTQTWYHPDWSRIGAELMRSEAEIKRLENLELVRLRQDVLGQLTAIRRNVRLVDELDVLLGFAQLAHDNDLVRPELDDSSDLQVVEGRHLSVEMGLLEQHRMFQPNDVTLSPTSRLHVITGPNMGGKSTYLRHAALIAILAQCGSFVPAKFVKQGIVDRVFSRVGARDDVSRDRSTFMVEMSETSEILRRATSRSLVIADEIGRGTTTEVGIAIAFATLHHLYEVNRSRTLFATHLHELADMLGWSKGRETASRVGGRFPHVDFFCTDVDVLEDGAISFSHKLRSGVNRDSHGLQVAQLAEMPPQALRVAHATLQWLESAETPAEQGSVESDIVALAVDLSSMSAAKVQDLDRLIATAIGTSVEVK